MLGVTSEMAHLRGLREAARSACKLRAVFLTASLSAVLSITACSPDTRGSLALTRDDAGGLVAIIVTCGARFDGLKLSSGPLGSAVDEQIGLWQHDGGIGDGAALSLTSDTPGGGWVTVRAWDGVIDDRNGYEF